MCANQGTGVVPASVPPQYTGGVPDLGDSLLHLSPVGRLKASSNPGVCFEASLPAENSLDADAS